MRGIKTLQIVSEGLQIIDCPPLRRPPVKPDDPKTEELIKWAVCMYSFGLITHLKKILAGLVQLAESENIACTAPLCRHVFEWAAVSCYITARLKGHFTAQNWKEAWGLLTQTATGSFWLVKHASKYEQATGSKMPVAPVKPIYTPEAITEYENFQRQSGVQSEAVENYSFLCDFAHANPNCLMLYHEYAESGVVTKFVAPDTIRPQESFLPIVNCCLIDLLTFLTELLDWVRETVVRPKVHAVLRRLAEFAPNHLTKSVPA